MGQLRNTK